MTLKRVWLVLRYAGLFTVELVKANIDVARLVLRSRMTFRPAILAFRHRCESDLELTILANSITLTPGTMVVDLSPDQKILYVHALSAEDPDAVIASIQKGLADPIREIFR